MGIKLTVSCWRHMAIAIFRRHLLQNEDSDDGEDEEDDIHDLQAAHSTITANRRYAVMTNGSMDLSNDLIDKYRNVSVQWHSILFQDIPPSVNYQNYVEDDHFKNGMKELQHQRLTELSKIYLPNRHILFFDRWYCWRTRRFDRSLPEM
jgi:hypothetical protein